MIPLLHPGSDSFRFLLQPFFAKRNALHEKSSAEFILMLFVIREQCFTVGVDMEAFVSHHSLFLSLPLSTVISLIQAYQPLKYTQICLKMVQEALRN